MILSAEIVLQPNVSMMEDGDSVSRQQSSRQLENHPLQAAVTHLQGEPHLSVSIQLPAAAAAACGALQGPLYRYMGRRARRGVEMF